MRTYNLDIVNADDHTIALFDRLTENELMILLRRMVLMGSYFLNIRINLQGE